jgi:cytochrome P450
MQAATAERRRQPREDLMSHLVAASDAGQISDDEVLGGSMLLFVAGITTTSGLLSNSLLPLATFPDQQIRLRDDPAIVPAAIEELLRYDAPIQAPARTATRDVPTYDATIPEGGRVVLAWGSANRDERRWDDPDRLDITRDPQRHVSFGDGIHHCLGAPRARLEARIAFEELFRRVREYVVDGPIVRVKTPTDRALESLPVAFRSRTSRWARKPPSRPD